MALGSDDSASDDGGAGEALFFMGFQHGSNKMHGWVEPPQPPMCSRCLFVAATQQSDTRICRQFMHMVLLAMFHKAGSYRQYYQYFDAFEARWRTCSPECILLAARVSLFPPELGELKKWCWRTYPELAYFLWTPRTIGRYSCCSQALDTLD